MEIESNPRYEQSNIFNYKLLQIAKHIYLPYQRTVVSQKLIQIKEGRIEELPEVNHQRSPWLKTSGHQKSSALPTAISATEEWLNLQGSGCVLQRFDYRYCGSM